MKNHNTVNVAVFATCNVSFLALSDSVSHIAVVYLNAAHVFFFFKVVKILI